MKINVGYPALKLLLWNCCVIRGIRLHLTFKYQGLHRLEKYLNLEGFLVNLPCKVLENHSKALKSPWILLFSVGLNTVDRDLNQFKIVVPLFGAAFAAPNNRHNNFILIIPAFFFRKKGYINFVSKSVRRPSVRPSVRTSVRHVSCKCISS